MKNQEIAKILYEIGEYLEMRDVAFKPRAYQKAAGAIEGLAEDVAEIYKRGGLKALEEIPGVGASIAEKIEEFIKTGAVKEHERLKKKTPVDLAELTAIEGLGPKHIKTLYQKLGVRNIKELERAARVEKIRKLEGFGVKSEENIIKGIEFLKNSGGRYILGFTMPIIKEIEKRLEGLEGVKKAVAAGSVRRRKETIGDADILVVSDKPGKVMDYFVGMPEVINVYARGETKSAVKINNGMDVDLRVVPEESYGAALAYFTGSKNHNVALREIAIKKGYKLNEYGLYSAKGGSVSGGKGKKFPIGRSLAGRQIAGRAEEEIYKALGLDYIEPEMRENIGEIELARKRELPELIDYGDLRGDLQVQTDWTDGTDSIEAMAKAAIELGLKYIAVTDHTKRLVIARGLDEKRVVKQWEEIDRLNKKFGGKLKILKGSECDILKDGNMDLPDEILVKLDVVGGSVHSHFNMTRKDQTERIKRAMANPHVDIIFHPTGRLIQKRDAYELDMDDIIKTAKRTKTVLEINAFPDRSDLKDEYIRKCVEAGVKMAIDSDAHSAGHFVFLEYGIAQARRGWATRQDIVNAWNLDRMLSLLKKSG